MSIKDSGERTEFTTGAVRDMHAGKGRFDLLPWHAIHEVAKHCEEGALKYGERNVDRGIPQHSFIDSATRHLVKYIHNETDEKQGFPPPKIPLSAVLPKIPPGGMKK